MRIVLLGTALVAALTGIAGEAHGKKRPVPPPPPAEPQCTGWIDSLPASINQAGYYCLTNNVSTSDPGGAININASGVTVDCKDYALSHADRANEATGIGGGGFGPVQDVTVKSCKLVDFATGIIFSTGSQRIQVLDNHVLRAKYDGIVLWASNSRIERNSVINTHAPAFPYSRNITVTALEPGVPSTGNVISGNVVAGAYGNGTTWGIRADMSNDLIIDGNRVINLQVSEGGYSAAIQTDGTNVRVLNNILVGNAPGSWGNTGNPAICSGNVATGLVSDGFQWCTESTGNTVVP